MTGSGDPCHTCECASCVDGSCGRRPVTWCLAPGERRRRGCLPGAGLPTVPSLRGPAGPESRPGILSLSQAGQRGARMEQLGGKPWGMKQRHLGWGWRLFWKPKANRYANTLCELFPRKSSSCCLPRRWQLPALKVPGKAFFSLPHPRAPLPPHLYHKPFPQRSWSPPGRASEMDTPEGLACPSPQQGSKMYTCKDGYKTQSWYFGLKIKK